MEKRALDPNPSNDGVIKMNESDVLAISKEHAETYREGFFPTESFRAPGDQDGPTVMVIAHNDALQIEGIESQFSDVTPRDPILGKTYHTEKKRFNDRISKGETITWAQEMDSYICDFVTKYKATIFAIIPGSIEESFTFVWKL